MKLFKHQIDAADFCEGKSGVMIRMSQGLGKTYAALEVARRRRLDSGLGKVLVISRNGVHLQWLEEIEKFFDGSGVAIRTAHQSAKMTSLQKRTLIDRLTSADEFGSRGGITFVATNIDTFSSNTKWEALAEFADGGMIILDESHSIKSFDSKRSMNILLGTADVKVRGAPQKRHYANAHGVTEISSRAKFRICLTGTPIGNRTSDIFMQAAFLADRPIEFFADKFGYQGNTLCKIKDEFVKDNEILVPISIFRNGRTITAEKPIDEASWNKIKKSGGKKTLDLSERKVAFICGHEFSQKEMFNEDARKAALADVIFSRNKADCVDLPDKIYDTRKLYMSPDVSAAYNVFRKKLFAEIGDGSVSARDAMTKTVRLRQICSGFVTDDDGKDFVFMGNSKLAALLDDLSMTRPPVIIVTQFKKEAEIVFDAIRKALPDLRAAINDGSHKRLGMLKLVTDAFKDGEIDVMVANQQTISCGFNFQNCKAMFFYSNGFSFIDRAQIEDRIHRIGTEESPLYVDYEYVGCIDGIIKKCLDNKCTDAKAFCDAFGLKTKGE